MGIQSLLFGRNDWTEAKAKQWAAAHGYKSTVTDVTDQYIRIRQFDPKGLKVKRTITLGRGIRAVVAREEDTAMKRRRTTKKRSSGRSTAAASAKPAFGSPAWFKMYPRKKGKRKARRARETTAVVAAPRRRKARRVRAAVAAPRKVAAKRRKTRRVRASVTAPRQVAAKRRRKARRVRAATPVVQAKRRRRVRRVRAAVAAAPRKVAAKRRKSRRRSVRAWYGNTPGHRKAAKKGHARKKKSHRTRELSLAAPRRHKRRKTRRVRELSVAAPRRHKRRKHHRARETSMVKSRRRRHYARAGKLSAMGAKIGKIAICVAVAGAGFTISDGVDRFLATYNPNGKKAPKDKFTSGGAGTLANALNVASSPHALRIANAVGQVLLPAIVSVYVKNPLARSSMESYAVGAGVKVFQLLWTNVLMPMLGAHKDGDDPEKLKGSVIARLYPAEVAAKLNKDQKPAAEGALSGPDVGPFALAADSPYPDAVQALRRGAGVSDNETYPTAAQALRKQTGVDGPLGFRPMPPTGRYNNHPQAPLINRWHGAHPQFQPGGYAHSVAMSRQWGRFQAPSAPGHHHHHCMLRAKTMYPSYTAEQLHSWCLAHPHSSHPYLYTGPTQNPVTGVISDPDPTQAFVDQQNAAPAPDAAPAPAPFQAAAVPTPDPIGPPSYAPGPGTSPGPGPQPVASSDCGCGDDNKYLGFIGDSQEESLFDIAPRK
jgi:DNA-binding protein HU-beta